MIKFIDVFKKLIMEAFKFKTEKDKTSHIHDVSVNADGNGKTISSSGEKHVHKIFEWIVQPANSHIHNIDI